MAYSISHEHREQIAVYKDNTQIGMVVQNVTQTRNWAPNEWFGIFVTADGYFWTIGPYKDSAEAIKKVEYAHSRKLNLHIWIQYPQDFVG